ncbi:hypothetical protein GWK47_013670 [Chionoecetes opilio]|uniref:Secreted protein n=1 Tax=Chionoecetes opilio TaxID=41210 RepID=A0A8J4XTV3_CHIOP|nr:hypothetical protein GWK47_013670 [Chionoecetes opilio]
MVWLLLLGVVLQVLRGSGGGVGGGARLKVPLKAVSMQAAGRWCPAGVRGGEGGAADKAWSCAVAQAAATAVATTTGSSRNSSVAPPFLSSLSHAPAATAGSILLPAAGTPQHPLCTKTCCLPALPTTRCPAATHTVSSPAFRRNKVLMCVYCRGAKCDGMAGCGTGGGKMFVRLEVRRKSVALVGC